jgi:hypothetical protein
MRLRSGKKINEKEVEPADNGVCSVFTYMILLFATVKGTQILVSSIL